ncbi:transmembrane protein 11 homolog, mitochondrial [Zerene cesonia]|uniref:transmembrane protein 11 homolog, mitochondrial n=1 Tax=Zerene cesonia TaxID=33412 RepID=UPI0018E56784|nr:transmembrane protein 11 homolog, mitochondrial [Zerene cesonia]
MAGDETDSDLKPSSVAIIREVYDSENAHIKFEMELERALEAGVSIIVIEPEALGEDTARWIYVGNLLHKVSLYSGISSIASGLTWSSLACTPFGIISVLCAGCYTLSWQWDPCCKYQVEKNRHRLSTLPMLSDLTSATPVVLVRTDNKQKIILHSTVSIAAAAICLWRLYNTFK